MDSRSPSPPRLWTLWLGVFLAAVTLVVGSIVLAVVLVIAQGGMTDAEGLTTALSTGTAIAASAALSGLVFASVAIGAATLGPVSFRSRLRTLEVRWPVYAVVLVGTLGVSLASDAITMAGGLLEGSTIEMIARAVRSSEPAEFALLLVGGALFAAIGEELFFRGYLQTRLSRRLGSAKAIVITASCFALIHLDLVHSTFAFGFGLFIGYAVEKTGSILPAMLAHVVNNTLSFLISRWTPVQWPTAWLVATFVVGVSAAGAALWWLWRSAQSVDVGQVVRARTVAPEQQPSEPN